MDPDNRRPVDFAHRVALLDALRARVPGEGAEAPDLTALCAELLEHWPDGRVKLYLTHRALTLRRQRARLFAAGEYRGLAPGGRHADHVVALARRGRTRRGDRRGAAPDRSPRRPHRPLPGRRARVGAHVGRSRRRPRRRLPRPLLRAHGGHRAVRRRHGAPGTRAVRPLPGGAPRARGPAGREPEPGGAARASDAVRRGGPRGRHHAVPPLGPRRSPGRALARGAGARGGDAARRGRMGRVRDAGSARGHALPLPHRRRAARARSGRALPARRRARRERGRGSPGPCLDRHRLDRAPSGAARVLRAARRHLHRGRHLRGRGRAARSPGRPRRHRGGADAAGRLPGPPGLGLRRRAPLRARGDATAGPRTSRPWWTPRTRAASPSSSTSSTTTSGPRATTCTATRPTSSTRATRPRGATGSTTTGPARRWCARS